jgi:FKBP-type peptidyl-prolyl cis-trans isomerase FkpA
VAKPGQMVTMNYIGKTLEGKQFDANVDASFKPLKGRDPFTFPLGAHQVIKGWDEGVALLKKGSKATFYIPSPLAYGPQAQGPDLPANSILVFNVEVVDIKAGGSNTPPAPGPGQ